MRWHIFLERGTQQIRTAVHGFADRYLATRSGYPVLFNRCKDKAFFPFDQTFRQIFSFSAVKGAVQRHYSFSFCFILLFLFVARVALLF